jgi:hypothetical protein
LHSLIVYRSFPELPGETAAADGKTGFFENGGQDLIAGAGSLFFDDVESLLFHWT